MAESGAFQLKVGGTGGSREEACGALALPQPLITQNNADFVFSSRRDQTLAAQIVAVCKAPALKSRLSGTFR